MQLSPCLGPLLHLWFEFIGSSDRQTDNTCLFASRNFQLNSRLPRGHLPSLVALSSLSLSYFPISCSPAEKISISELGRRVMAFVSHFNQFPSKTLSVTPPHNPQLPSKFPVFSHMPVAVPTSPSLQSLLSARQTPLPRPLFRVRAATDGDSVGEGYGVAVADEEKLPELIEIDKLKKALVDSFYGTDRGLKATSETRAEIVELITQLESKNPNPAPTEALTLLNGKWILAYTSFSGLFPLLARGGGLPLVKVEEISQTIDSVNFTVQNSVQFAGPLTTTSVSTNAKFEVRSPKRVQIKFQEGIIGTPQLTDSIEIPENVEFLGQKFDLTPVKGILNSVQETASSVVKTISNQPPLKFSIPNRNAESWLLTTYLDEDLRISRGDGGSVFVLIKEGSTLLTT